MRRDVQLSVKHRHGWGVLTTDRITRRLLKYRISLPNLSQNQISQIIEFPSHMFTNKFETEHGSDTAVLCAKFQNGWEN